MPTILQTPTPNMTQSLAFYNKLGFSIISPTAPTIVSDGNVAIEINPDRFARAGVKCFKPSWEKEAARLNELTTVIKTDSGYLLADFSNTWIYLVEGETDHDISKSPPSIVGNFAGLSLETIAIEKSVSIWEAAGFDIQSGSAQQGWVSLSNSDGFGISIMKPMSCPHLFFNPSLTYFNSGKNPEVIEKVRAAKIPITEEITYFNKEGIVDNIIIRDPGGFGFFIFND